MSVEHYLFDSFGDPAGDDNASGGLPGVQQMGAQNIGGVVPPVGSDIGIAGPGITGGGFAEAGAVDGVGAPGAAALHNPLERIINGHQGEEYFSPSAGSGLVVEIEGKDYLLTEKATEESCTIADEHGMSILSDTNGDGRVDYVSSVTFDGKWSAWRWNGGEPEVAASESGAVEVRSTPEYGQRSWNSDSWTCVDRGGWG